jgi:hypothetical protein
MNNHGKRYGEIINEIKDLHDKKNADYAGQEDSLANLRMCEKMGVSAFVGVVIRLCDKFSRLMRFCKTKELQVKDESIKDTLKDIVNYALFAIIFLEEEEQKRNLVGMHVSPVVGKEYPDLTDPYSQTLQFLKDKERKNVS